MHSDNLWHQMDTNSTEFVPRLVHGRLVTKFISPIGEILRQKVQNKDIA